MKLSRYEQETIVSYNAGEQTATIYTRDKAVMRKLDTLVADFPATYKLMKQDEVSKTYSFPNPVPTSPQMRSPEAFAFISSQLLT